MAILECRRDRLVHVLDLARMYRGWTRQEVAAALGREPSKVVPESVNPKLDLVVGIAKLLEWSVGEVAECLWDESRVDNDSPSDARPASIVREAPSSNSDRAFMLATSARRLRREGHFQRAVERLQRAMLEPSLPWVVRSMLQAELAEAHYLLWHLAEARSLASELLRQTTRQESASSPQASATSARAPIAFATAIRGHASRRLMRTQPELRHRHASAGRADLVAALSAIDELLADPSTDLGDASAPPSLPDSSPASPADAPTPAGDGALVSMDRLLAVANTAKAGIVECEVELGAMPADEGVSQLLRGLDAVIDPDSMEVDAMLESWGWWSVFGANLVLAHFHGDAQQRLLGIFTNKALEIAHRTGSWALRERAFMFEHLRRERAERDERTERSERAERSGRSERAERADRADRPARPGESGTVSAPDPDHLVLDHDEVRSIIGTMGRFAHFRDAGWSLLRRAAFIE